MAFYKLWVSRVVSLLKKFFATFSNFRVSRKLSKLSTINIINREKFCKREVRFSKTISYASVPSCYYCVRSSTSTNNEKKKSRNSAKKKIRKKLR